MQRFKRHLLPVLGIPILFVALSAQTPFLTNSSKPIVDTLSESDRRSAKNAVSGLKFAPNLSVSLFASEPSITNPTNLDIDHKGRVWISEAFNYRPLATGNLPREAGDRIMILEDWNQDGIADTSKVFYQGKEIHAPIGICVLGNKVIVSQAPNIWLLTDEDGDDKADKIEAVFTGVSGEQHDHAIHSFSLGPDGKLYFAMGNESKQLMDRHGKPVKDQFGKVIDFKKYREGLLLRCDLDFTNVEVLGQNFRNNYEPTVDSYGTIWQSDNDDDGNQAVRMNYVMENGNYGFSDELTGAGWRATRTNVEDSLQRRHWHQNDPGTVPNLIHTGAGSPTGLTVYEGNLLPETFRNQLLHCDAGPNVVRAYPVKKDGAGYTATMENLVEGEKDKWFRPTDVAVAPDGSVFISDWYDPVVGGHHMGDAERGRVYRVAPKNVKYTFPAINLTTSAGIMAALASPNIATRYEAWKKIQSSNRTYVPDLLKLANNESAPSRHRARAIWLLSKMKQVKVEEWSHMLKSGDPDLRITTIRALKQLQVNILPFVKDMTSDQDPQVRRELALILHDIATPEAAKMWAKLALQHNATDRWQLEALGIGAKNNWDSFFQAWLNVADKNPIQSAAGKDIVWRARTGLAVPYLSTLLSDNNTEQKEKLRYFRAFDFNPGDSKLKANALLPVLNTKSADQAELTEIVFRHLDPAFVTTDAKASAILKKSLDENYGTEKYIELLTKYKLTSEHKRLLDMAINKSSSGLGRSAGQLLWNQGGQDLIKKTIFGGDTKRATATLAAIRSVGTTESTAILESILKGKQYSTPLQVAAAQSMAGTWPGEELLLTYLRKGMLKEEVKIAAVKAMSNAWRKGIRQEANSFLKPESERTAKKSEKHPPIKELITKSGNAANGKQVFKQYCEACHQVGKEGLDFGPKLTEIGAKLPKEGLYMALIFPNAGVSFGYETSEIKLKDGSVIMGIVASKTEKSVLVKFPGGATQEYAQDKVQSIKRLEESMMPAGLEDAMSTTELTDLIEYLHQLK
jgi:putative membrane-bound dehydrogenase-like protein